MWETIKNDPILKAVTIIVLSILGFGFAFNIMFGPNNQGMEQTGEMSGGGYSIGNTLSTVFVLAFKLLLIVLVVAAIIAIFKLARKYIFDGGDIKMFESIKKDPVLKGITISVLFIAALGLIYYLFAGLFGFGNGYGTMSGNNGYSMITGGNGYSMTGNGYGMVGNGGYNLGLSGLLAVLLKLLLASFFVGLILGLVMYVKQSYGKEIVSKISSVKIGTKPSIICSHCGAGTTSDFKYCPYCGKTMKEGCPSCGAELKDEWKCCPVCGNEKEASSKETTVEDSLVNAEEKREGVSEDIISEITAEASAENSSNTGNTTKHLKGKRS